MTWALIQWDAKRIPVKSIVIGLGIASGLPVIWPDLLPVQWYSPSLADVSSTTYTRHDVLTTLLAGGAMGLVSCHLLSHFRKSGCTILPRMDRGSWAGFALLGLSLGWQTMLTICFFAACVTLALKFVGWFRVSRPLRSPPLLVLLIVAILCHSLWRWLFEATTRLWCFPQPGIGSLIFWMAFTSVSLILFWYGTRQRNTRRAKTLQHRDAI
jgi:hypothetical protein